MKKIKTIKLYTTRSCSFCRAAKDVLAASAKPFEEVSLDENPQLRETLSRENSGWRTVPMIFIGEEFIGGFTELNALIKAKKLDEKLNSGS